MTTLHDGGCRNPWCMQYRAGLRTRNDRVEASLRAADRKIRELAVSLEHLTAPPVEPVEPAQQQFVLRAWILFGLILIVLGAGLVSVALIGEHVMSNTTFYEGP